MNCEAQAQNATASAIGAEVTAEPYAAGNGLPLFITPVDPILRADTAAAVAWLRSRVQAIDELLCDVGAVVLRDFAFDDVAAFNSAIAHYPDMPFGYVGGATPRSVIQGRAYEATRAPAELKLQFHQEMSYLPNYPSKLAFFCNQEPDTGGETLIADVRRFDAAVPQAFRDEVKRRGVRYARNFRAPDWKCGDDFLDNSHLVWPDVFGTTDIAEAEEACRKMGVEPRWEKNGSLSVFYTTTGFVTHPRSGREIWFNQIASQSPNPWSECEGMLERIAKLAHLYSDDAPPAYATTFGDGGAIPIGSLKPIYDLLESLEVAFPWQRRDLMLLDNFYVFHGRNSYTGPRDVQVALLG